MFVARGKFMLIIWPFQLSELCRPVLWRSFASGIAKERALNQWCRRQGCIGCKRNLKSFDLSKIREKSRKTRTQSLNIQGKSLKIWAKIVTNVV